MRHLAIGQILAIVATLWGCSSPDSPGEDLSPGGGDMRPMGRVPVQHRPMATSCPMDRPAGTINAGLTGCKSDVECNDATKGKNGRCVQSRIGYVCSYDGCFADPDCGGKVCQCRAPAKVASTNTNHCLGDSNCAVDGDCGAGGFCSPTLGTCGNYTGVVAYRCHTPGDQCIDDADCTTDGGFGYCAYNSLTSTWQCSSTQCAG